MTRSLLVIDDSEEIVQLVKLAMRDEPLDVQHAADADEGLILARALQPDLILLDVCLPPTDGFEICRKLKSDPATQQIPIAFLSGSDDTDSKVCGLDLGAIDYITKPFAAAELRARVRSGLRIRQTFDRLSEQARYDRLTGLLNREGFDPRFHELLAAAADGRSALSLLLLDVDYFKRLNDSYGHLFGDEVLRRLGVFLIGSKRPGDVACRYGGEEFVLLLPDASHEGALAHAERLRLAVAGLSFRTGGKEVQITISGGLTTLNPVTIGCTPQQMFASSDAALYAAKEEGRNRIVVSTSEPIVMSG